MTENAIVDEVHVAELAAAATAFDWNWTTDDAARWCALVGWEIIETVPSSGTLIARTNLTVSRPEAEFTSTDGTIREVSAFVTDVVPKTSRPRIVDAFALIVQRLTASLGAPTTTRPGETPSARWLLPNVALFVMAGRRSVLLYFRNPAVQRQYDERDAAPDA